MIHQHRYGIENGVLAAHIGDALLAPVSRLEVRGVPLDNRIAQLNRSAHGGILAEVALNRSNGGVFHVLRRSKVWLARAKVNYVNPLLRQLVGLGHNGHGGGNLNPLNAFRKLNRRCFARRTHDCVFLFLPRVLAGILDFFGTPNFARSLCSINPGTSAPTGPPIAAISRTSRELT